MVGGYDATAAFAIRTASARVVALDQATFNSPAFVNSLSRMDIESALASTSSQTRAITSTIVVASRIVAATSAPK